MKLNELYTVTRAAEVIGISKGAIRAYTLRPEYQRYLSTEATPEAGKERKFTRDDLRLLKFIFEHTNVGETHKAIVEHLSAGKLDDFDWSPPEPQQAVESGEASTTALVPIEQLRAIQAILADTRQREGEAREQAQAQIQALQEEMRQERKKVEELQRELGQAQGALEAYKDAHDSQREREELAIVAKRRRPPRWWVTLFGGE